MEVEIFSITCYLLTKAKEDYIIIRKKEGLYMLLTMIILILLILAEITFTYKKRITWGFVLYFTGILVLFASSVMLLIKFTSYRYINSLDYSLYYLIKGVRINILNLARLCNFGLSLTMTAAITVNILLSEKKTRIMPVILAIPVIIFYIINDPRITYEIFLRQHYVEDPSYILVNALKYLQLFSLTVFSVYMLLPLFSLISYSRNTKLILLKKNTLITGLCLLLIDAFLVYCFIFGILSHVMPWSVDLNKFPTTAISYDSHLFMVPITLLMGVAVIILSIQLKPVGAVKILTRRQTNMQFYALNHNLRMIFHINKNALHTIEKLAEQSLMFYEKNNELALENIKHIMSTSKKGLDTISQMLSMLDDVHVENSPVSLKDCINNAHLAVHIPDNISFIETYRCDDITIHASEIHITEVFTNLFKNAVETIQLKGSEDGRIEVTMYREHNLAVVEVYDNGKGIKKSDMKQIFSVLFSTKHNSKNWGIGLSYVKKVIDIYGGYIYVKSKPEEFACFQIIIPTGKEDI